MWQVAIGRFGAIGEGAPVFVKTFEFELVLYFFRRLSGDTYKLECEVIVIICQA